MSSAILRGVGDPVQLDSVLGVPKKIIPKTPAVILMDPRDGYNVGNVQRACSNWGVEQLWWTGNRVSVDFEGGERLPREERMKGWANVSLLNVDRPFDYYKKLKVPIIGCELVQGATNLFHFEHPENAVYVFGPEDDEIPNSIRGYIHQFVMAPTHHCLNLACAVNTVLAFRRLNLIQRGLEEDKPVNDWLREHRGVM